MSDRLQEFAAACEAAEKVTPTVVAEAFLPTTKTVAGLTLRPISLGTWLVLERVAHPFVNQLGGGSATFTTYDLIVALFILTRPSAESMACIEAGQLPAAVADLGDQIEMGSFESLGEQLVEHIQRCMSTAVALRSPHSPGQKKTQGSAGG